MRQTFEKTAYWQLEPANELVNIGNLYLAKSNEEYLIYTHLPHCRVRLPRDQKYQVLMIDP